MRSTKSETTGQSATKTCKTCGETKTLDQYYFMGSYPRPDCKPCQRQHQQKHYKLRKKYKTPEIGTACDCCGRTDQKLCWDHCHDTEEHRGWLCSNCNQALGKLGDDIEGVLKAVDYLAKFHNLGLNQETNDDLAAA